MTDTRPYFLVPVWTAFMTGCGANDLAGTPQEPVPTETPAAAPAKRWAAATDRDELVTLPGVNHVLKESPEDMAGNMATYANPDLPLADTIAPAIADFIRAQ